jgi:hypothetical protein
VHVNFINYIATASGIESLRDFGGLYFVHGLYLLEPAVHLRCRFASMVDGTAFPEWEQKKAEAMAQHPGLEVEFVHDDFRKPELYSRLREVDGSILYDVLLHQENYVQVVKDVISRTRKYVFFTQPCIREELFPLPSAAVLLQFYPKALKQILRTNSFWPDEPEPMTTYMTHYWMWGQTTSNIISTFHGFGWEVDSGLVVDNITGDYWEYPLLRFRRR